MWLRIQTLFCFVISLDEVNHFVHPHASYPWCIAATAGHSVNTQMSAKIIRYPRTMKWNWWNLVYPIYALHSAGLHGTNLEGNHLNVNFVCCSFMKRIYNWALWRILLFFFAFLYYFDPIVVELYEVTCWKFHCWPCLAVMKWLRGFIAILRPRRCWMEILHLLVVDNSIWIQ